MVNDEQYDSPQQKVENEGQPQGMIAQERMQAEEQTEERSRGYGGRTEHRLRLGNAYKDAIERMPTCQTAESAQPTRNIRPMQLSPAYRS